MNLEQIHRFLDGISHKIVEQKKIAALTGENFNVFRILGLEAAEVRTHSAFLGELLNPEGSHGQGSLFLNLFLASFTEPSGSEKSAKQRITEFDPESASVELELYIGQIDAECTKGGRIDIVLTDKNNKRIFIENKIYAIDQKNQLLRYHKYDPNATLVYVTLDGVAPSKESLGQGDFEVHSISYEKQILNWLIRCRNEAAMLPTIREGLTQYIELLRNLTNQTTRQSMKEEIKSLILKNPELVEAIDAGWQSLAEIISVAEKNFWDVVRRKMAEKVKPININDRLIVFVNISEDGDGVYIGYRLMDGDANSSISEQGIKYADQLQSIDPAFIRNRGSIGWHNPVGFVRGVKVQHLDKQLLLKFYLGEKELDEFTDKIITKELEIRNALEQTIVPKQKTGTVMP